MVAVFNVSSSIYFTRLQELKHLSLMLVATESLFLRCRKTVTSYITYFFGPSTRVGEFSKRHNNYSFQWLPNVLFKAKTNSVFDL